MVALISSVVLNLYLVTTGNRVPEQENGKVAELQSEADIVTTRSSSIKKKQDLEKSSGEKKEEVISSEADTFINPTMYTGLPTEQEMIESQERWRENVTDFFIDGLDLRESDADKYFEIKDLREKELSKFLTERIRSQGSFIYTLEDMVDENKINEKYLNQLRTLMGKDGYNSYRAFRDNHNQQMIESQQMHSLIEL